MKHILSGPHVHRLSSAIRARTLIGFDFDGTLAPTVPDRERAGMRAATLDLFTRVCRHYPCAVISGRGRRDVQSRLGGAAVIEVVGNHGLEPSEHMEPFAQQVAATHRELQDVLAAHEGIEIEDKRYSLALHYRHAPDKAKALRAIRAAVAGITSPQRVVPGKLVVNIVPRGAPHKGDALLRLWRQAGAEQVVFVGDDLTDEDVFQLGQPERLLSVRIGRSKSSAAHYYLRDQREMDTFLTRLVDLRESGVGP